MASRNAVLPVNARINRVQDLKRFTPFAITVLRVVTALLFMQRGLQKLLLFPVPSHGTPDPGSIVWLAGLIEAGGGAFIAAGLFTRLSAFVASGEMAVAYWTVHAPVSFFPVVNDGDLAILFCFVFAFLAISGPGEWSIDGLMHGRVERGSGQPATE